MLATELRDKLVREMMRGRRPQVVLMTTPDWMELVGDLTGRRDAFEPIYFQGVMVVTEDQILTVASKLAATPPTTAL